MSNKFLADHYTEESKQFIAMVSDLKNSRENVIDLSLGDPDIITAKSIIKDTARDAENGHTRYTHPLGDADLRKEIINYYQKNYGISLSMKEVMVTVGACHGTFLALASVLNSGEEVIIPTPYFTPYKEQVNLAGGKAVFFETNFNQDFQIDTDELEKLINSKTKAILLNSPHNPTGAVQKKENIKKIVEIAKKHDILIFSDEVYEIFDYEDDFYSLINFRDDKQRIILLNSFSKMFSMTGWRVGFTVAPSEIIKVMQEINEGVCYSAPSISQRAAISALKEQDKIKEKIIKTFRERVYYSWKRIERNEKLETLVPQGTFYLYVNIKKTGFSSRDFVLKLLKEEGVLVLPGEDFGDNSGEFVRIACTQKLHKMKEAFDRIDHFIEKTGGE